jgi:protocatechuate 3,4-dioxygenase beta subunit
MDLWVEARGRIGAVAIAVALGVVTSSAALQTPAKPEVSTSASARKAAMAGPAPVTSLELIVTDAGGKPIEGAFVIALPAQGATRPYGGVAAEKARSAVTDREGKAKLNALPPGSWNLTVRARGFVPQPLRRVATGPLSVRLQKGGVITGVVRDGEMRRRVAKCRVAVEEELLLPPGWAASLARNETTSDAHGRFRLDGIGPAPVTLAVTAPGFARTERGDVRAGASVEFFLFPGASLAGSVSDDVGRPVAGATVRAEGDQTWGAPTLERTDARGQFRMSGVPPGEYTAVARAGGRAPGIAVAVVEPLGEATVRLTVSDGGYAIGRIVDAEGRPLAGRVRVEVLSERSLPAFASELMAAEAGTDGTFALGPLPLGALGLDVSAPRHASRRIDVEIPARGRTAELGEVALEAGLAIRGRVREREGGGVAGAAVRATLRDAGGASDGEATSEADGTFLVAGLRPGRHYVSAAAPGYATAHATASPGGEALELVLEPGGQLVGRVVDADGAPVEEALVSAEDAGGASGPGGFVSGRADEGDGGFVLRDVAAGSYSLEVRAGSRGEASMTGVRVAAGRATNVGTIALSRGGVVQGVVVDAEGNGIPGAVVRAERDARRRTGQLHTQSGSNGGFELRGVPIGPVYLSAAHPAYAAGRDVAVTVQSDPEPVPVRLVLVRGGRLEGRAQHRDGRPFAGGRISHYSLEAAGGGMGWETAAIGVDGSFALDHVTPGRIVVSLMAFTPASLGVVGSSANILESVASREVEVREGETTSVDLWLRDVLVAGSVTRGGQPAPGVLVNVVGGAGSSTMTWVGPRAARAVAPGPPPLAATTREDGSYELLVFTPGRAYVEMQSDGQRHPGREVEIPDVDRFQLDLELGSATVSGMVVGREDGSPVPEASIGLRKTDGNEAWGGGAESGPDGRFAIAAEPGEYRLEARAPDRQPVSLPLSVGAAGVPEIRVELERGLEIAGRLLDAAGRPAPGLLILVTPADGEGSGHADSAPDGRFRIGGLVASPHTLVGGSELAGYAVRSGVTPGGDPIVLTLRPAGRIAVRVVDAAGQAVREAYPRVESIDGLRLRIPGRSSGPTDANGSYEFASPPGLVEVTARHEKRSGRGSVSVRSGETASLTVVLQAEPAKAP